MVAAATADVGKVHVESQARATALHQEELEILKRQVTAALLYRREQHRAALPVVAGDAEARTGSESSNG